MQDTNPVLYHFAQELLACHVGLDDIALSRPLARHAAQLLYVHVSLADSFFKSLDRSLRPSCKEYAEKYSGVLIDNLPIKEGDLFGQMSRVLFPGNKPCRPMIFFDTNDYPNCNKYYVSSKKFTPVLCTCSRPKLLGYIVMTRPKSVALAVSSILANFKVPPRVIYYDNGCNFFQSVIPRTPWLLHYSKVVSLSHQGSVPSALLYLSSPFPLPPLSAELSYSFCPCLTYPFEPIPHPLLSTAPRTHLQTTKQPLRDLVLCRRRSFSHISSSLLYCV